MLCASTLCPLLLTACRPSVPPGTDGAPGVQSPAPMKTPAPAQPSASHPVAVSSPPVYIYKMRKDYSQHVPVIMNPERTKIISYPAPTDLTTNGKLALPTPLHDGYWLDNRGINAQVAFLSYTYEEYSRFTDAPSMAELTEHILDKHPLTEFRACGRRADYKDKDIVNELNRLIDSGFGK